MRQLYKILKIKLLQSHQSVIFYDIYFYAYLITFFDLERPVFASKRDFLL